MLIQEAEQEQREDHDEDVPHGELPERLSPRHERRRVGRLDPERKRVGARELVRPARRERGVRFGHERYEREHERGEQEHRHERHEHGGGGAAHGGYRGMRAVKAR